MRRDLLVELKTIDLVRETAWLALTEKLGWEGTLLGLNRYELWRFEGAAGEGEPAAEAALESELERSSAYYNPNKESRRFLPDGRLGEGELLEQGQALPAPASPAAGQRWQALLWITDEGGSRPALRERSGTRLAPAGFDLERLRSGTLWELDLVAENAEAARGLLTGLALSRGRHEGLLFNPHYQEGRLLELEPAVPAPGGEA
jgi:hypothetical protein